MSALDELRDQIRATVLDLSDGIPVNALAEQIVLAYLPDFQGRTDLVAMAVWRLIRREVGSVLTRGTPRNGQPELTGFPLLQSAYLVGEDEAQRIIPLAKLEYRDILFIVHRLQSEAEAKAAHADELIRYARVMFGDSAWSDAA